LDGECRDRDGQRDGDPGRCRDGHHDRHHQERETALHGVERAKHQAPDAEADLQRHIRCAKLQRSFEKRDGQHHPEPDEGDGGGDRRSGAHLAAACGDR
jgi:hypothetical protein